MKRVLYLFLLLLLTAAAFVLGSAVSRMMAPWFLAEGVILGLVLAAALLLPGPSALWAELLGTAATLPLLLRAMPVLVKILALFWLPEVVFVPLAVLLCLMAATLAPMLLLLVAGRLLE